MATLLSNTQTLSDLIPKSELDSIKSLPKSIQNTVVSIPQPRSAGTLTSLNLTQLQKLVPGESDLRALSPKTKIPGIVNVIFGTPGDDPLPGTNTNDLILGLGGDDTIFGFGGHDVLFGGSGNDIIFGGSGNDVLFGGSGNDFLLGGSGNDCLYGGSGNDFMFGGSGNDFLSGGLGNDILIGGSGNDCLFGNSGNDRLFGGSGNDTLSGGSGNDSLVGGLGNDILIGGFGDDTIVGVNPNGSNPGINEKDTLTGGAGADKFVIGDSKNPYYVGGKGFLGLNDYALLKDFQSGTDKIQLKKANYIFGSNFIALNNGFSSSEKSLASAEQIVQDIAGGKSLGVQSQLSTGDSLKSVQIVPNFGFDVIAIVSDGYNQGDLSFV